MTFRVYDDSHLKNVCLHMTIVTESRSGLNGRLTMAPYFPARQ